MRVCPKCGAYYADGSSGFCLVDGMPLVNIDPNSDRWSEGTRALKEKDDRLRKQKRKLNWRGVFISTMLVATIAVWGASFNRWTRVEFVPTPTPTPTPSPSPSPSPTPTLSPSPTPTPSPSPSPSPSVYTIRGRVMSLPGPRGGITISLAGSMIKSATATTDRNGYYTFGKLPAGGSYTITPRDQARFDPPNHSVDSLRRDERRNFLQVDATPSPPACSDRDMYLEAEAKIQELKPRWERMIRDEQDMIRDKYAQGSRNAEVILGKITYRTSFPKPCEELVVTASYTWRVYLPPTLITSEKTENVERESRFKCEKRAGAWRCS